MGLQGPVFAAEHGGLGHGQWPRCALRTTSTPASTARRGGGTVRASPGCIRTLSVLHSKPVVSGGFVCADRALDSPKRRLPARAEKASATEQREEQVVETKPGGTPRASPGRPKGEESRQVAKPSAKKEAHYVKHGGQEAYESRKAAKYEKHGGKEGYRRYKEGKAKGHQDAGGADEERPEQMAPAEPEVRPVRVRCRFVQLLKRPS